MDIPGDLKFAPSHEWVRVEEDGTITVGISGHAQEQLGDLVFVETPEIDRDCEAEEGIAVVESVKAASDIYAPVAGKIIDTNPNLADNPELVNTDPYGEGWLFKLAPNEVEDVENMMSPDDYEAFVESEE
ncbi:glycine cleavage system protein GcvH [Granulosicoccus antarcticus]|uniref:Glycine cleavage system H protein n=1 Tax=Granulosicoccus antarcticus IMCC3135 TaxID=1192854 RepID=A0A2Z2NLW1_9GAMM|nr:glycine cleavage system protein GcvH [Granulosicoccus antarcticus]ASJ72153.1 Glycine cleavage system H protein [Granulosicoccus antarcticus IMCC3135]